MATEQQQSILGYAGLGLFIGVLLFSFFYFITVRLGIAERFSWTWVFIHLLVLLGPALVLALVGSRRNTVQHA